MLPAFRPDKAMNSDDVKGLNEYIDKLEAVVDKSITTFQEYLDLVAANPKITRNAFQRVHDMIMSYESTTYSEYKKEVLRYHFFDDPIQNGKDAVFGIDVHLMKLVI